ncbi:MAG: hypothetical protein WBP93_18415 [Pyrinomonadaceae bacterium]
MMKLENRLQRLEQETGINEPCVVCDVLNAELAPLYAFCIEKGLHRDEGEPRDLMPRVCHWCGKTLNQDVTSYTVSERALIERYEAAFFEGRYCAPENAGVHDKLLAMYETVSRRTSGDYYGELNELERKAVDFMLKYIEENAPRPFYHYLCTVEGCACEYPKTEAEWQANTEQKRREAERRRAA